jgi:hypothetical protein
VWGGKSWESGVWNVKRVKKFVENITKDYWKNKEFMQIICYDKDKKSV